MLCQYRYKINNNFQNYWNKEVFSDMLIFLTYDTDDHIHATPLVERRWSGLAECVANSPDEQHIGASSPSIVSGAGKWRTRERRWTQRWQIIEKRIRRRPASPSAHLQRFCSYKANKMFIQNIWNFHLFSKINISVTFLIFFDHFKSGRFQSL